MILATIIFITGVILLALSIMSIRMGMNDGLDYDIIVVAAILMIEAILYGIVSR